MIIQKKVHSGFKEFERIKHLGVKQCFGKYQYILSSKKGEISLIELKDYFNDNEDLWEIYSLKGNLFEDIERFKTKKQAIKRAGELL
jgi:hypothetical protein